MSVKNFVETWQERGYANGEAQIFRIEISLQAGEIVAKLFDALHVQYLNPDAEGSLQSLNKLCVRLVFLSVCGIGRDFQQTQNFYTSIENIHKVIDNLFLNDLRDEFLVCKKKSPQIYDSTK